MGLLPGRSPSAMVVLVVSSLAMATTFSTGASGAEDQEVGEGLEVVVGTLAEGAILTAGTLVAGVHIVVGLDAAAAQQTRTVARSQYSYPLPPLRPPKP